MIDPRSLVDLALEARSIAHVLESQKGELDDYLDRVMPLNELAIAEKVDNYQYVAEELESNAAVWKKRKDLCAKQEKKYDGLLERLKDRLRVAMNVMQTDELRGNVYRFKMAKSPGRLQISDESKIPEKYKMVVTTTVIDKERIKKDLKDGVTIPGAELISEGSLRRYLSEGEEV